ncbi:two-partner secretion domain-containing protein [Pantoea phytobeneficialis]|uniref:Filamentous hemagglutinin n=1 Tax=Pantoea phytobeneficialis TaxID=2052056 RepID=A0AAP9H4T9_9GAMM|nr:filamentous hemagglutinin N-terminal domain-containing protein [Pantoea phytobeneficialis]MDO6406145.1 filamentous hemagglutinin N-terminal domain-containing protein [Pantoea phytobeneficialis]QGR06544.1 filamentous hemagglutinin [Pantoea phytobeneficialis]
MKIQTGLMKFSPLASAILLALPVMVNAADLSMPNGNINMANGVPVVNINGANGNGISHNIYDKLNVGKEGLIFNNSQNGANTSLAGQIAGNSNLASGTAKVILNEVTSKNKSNLNGQMEVAGDKAHLIIANPNGISCDSCGFINTDKVTMTTGKADLNNGELHGYSVNGGLITTNGLTSDSPTAILARSIVVNGDINASGQELTLIAGNNYVDTSNKVTGTVNASGGRNSYGIDVAKLGGMYANKINLISTENGIGVRNAGVLAAGSGGIQIDTNGRLINNSAQIKSTGAIAVKTKGALENVTGKIVSDKTISIDTNKNGINNSRAGNIMSGADIYISSGEFNNVNGKVAAAGTLAMNTNNATLTNYGKGNSVGIEAGVVVLQTGALNNNNGQIKGFYVGSESSNLSNNNGMIESYSDVDISTSGSVNNTSGLIRGANGHVKIDASKGTLTNSGTKSADAASSDSLGIIAGEGGIQISVAALNNSNGQIASAGDIGFLTKSNVNNVNGKIATKKSVSIKAASLSNAQSSIVGQTGVDIDLTGDVTNHIGIISSEYGDVNIRARHVNNSGGLLLGQNISLDAVHDVNNDTSLIVAQKKLTINAGGTVANQNGNNFGDVWGLYFGMPNQKGGMIGNGGVEITANTLNNNNSRIIAQHAPLTLAITGALYNDRSMLIGAGASSIKAGSLSSNYSTIHSTGDLSIDTRSLSLASSGSIIDNDATGIIAADGALTLNVANNFTNYGWITGKQKVSVNTAGVLYNRNTIYSDNETQVYAKSAVYNFKDMVAGLKLTVSATETVYNSGNMFTEGHASITGKRVYNEGNSAVMGGRQGLELETDTLINSGKVVGL